MAVEVTSGQSFTFELYPPRIPASATVRVYSPSGGLLASGSATVDTVNTTVGTVTDRESWTVASETGITKGRRYWVVPAGASDLRSLVTVESVTAASKLVNVYPPAARLPVSGDAFKGGRLTFALTSGYTANRGMHFRVEWAVTDADGAVEAYRTPFHVVRTVFDFAKSAADVRAQIAKRFSNRVRDYDADPTRLAELAERATDLVRRRIRASERYPHLVGDPSEFDEAARLALKIVLMDDGLHDNVADPIAYADALYRRLDEAVGAGIAACWTDSNDDGAVDEQETGSWTIRLTR